MLKLTLSLALAVLAAQTVSSQTIPVGGLCAGIAGPVSGHCASGSTCCSVGPDRSLCAAVTICPSQFIPVGGTCSGIAGPSPFPCFPGTVCCNLGPDHSVCKAKC
ncbi:hypothetical protein GALMADRAFT_153960 [Galerina marginata CBS 339.88]|uniref:Hydrophobin n=1 Tax=Galerina marginata (strain CBS 339.88) TaxID=685588 RepID=A0A067TK74_GALM3|nr:hypothetical protein GALMADRAFT_153960 [Galerina marginata CBS 339.88]